MAFYLGLWVICFYETLSLEGFIYFIPPLDEALLKVCPGYSGFERTFDSLIEIYEGCIIGRIPGTMRGRLWYHAWGGIQGWGICGWEGWRLCMGGCLCAWVEVCANGGWEFLSPWNFPVRNRGVFGGYCVAGWFLLVSGDSPLLGNSCCAYGVQGCGGYLWVLRVPLILSLLSGLEVS